MGDLEKYVLVAADSVSQLRRVDVFRVLESNRAEIRDQLANYIADKRPDLAKEVSEVMADEFNNTVWRAAPSQALDTVANSAGVSNVGNAHEASRPFDQVLLAEFLSGQSVTYLSSEGESLCALFKAGSERHGDIVVTRQGAIEKQMPVETWQAETFFLSLGDPREAMAREETAEREAALRAIGEVSGNVVLRSPASNRIVEVAPVTEESGPWAIQRYDNNGPKGRAVVHPTKHEALVTALRDGYTQREQGVSGRARAATAVGPKEDLDLFGDRIRPSYSPDTVRRANKVIEGFERVMEGLASPESLAERGFERIFENGDGAAIARLVMEKIADDAVFANGILGARCKRYAPDEWKATAEDRLGITAKVTALAAELGVQAKYAERLQGKSYGTILGETAHYLVQGIGRGEAVMHRKADFLSEVPRVGEKVGVQYCGGSASVQERHLGGRDERPAFARC